MESEYAKAGKSLPKNIDSPDDLYEDKLVRKLDCATIEHMHKTILNTYKEELATNGYSDTIIFDSTRGAFSEGGPAFSGAGISRKSHIQVCIRNMNSIKGFFIPREEIPFPAIG